MTVPVTVAQIALETVEDFEGRFPYGYGSGADFYPVTGESAYLGRTAGELRYTLDENHTSEVRGLSFAGGTIGSAYTALNLWVYGDGSDNQLALIYNSDETAGARLDITRLDFTGWKLISLSLPAGTVEPEGFAVYAPSVLLEDEEGNTLWSYEDTAPAGTIRVDQLAASFPGTVDTVPPAVTAELDTENWRVTARISDAVDGILPESAVSVSYNGSAADGSYNAKTGELTLALPAAGESGEAARVTVTAKDASGNIGRASVDIDAYNVGHKFSDIQDYWAATYVDFLYNAGITTGYSDGTFRPNQNISRAQFAVMLYRYLGLEESRYADVELPFADLGSIGDYAIPAVKALYSEGILTGTLKNGALYLNPGDALTRAQAATMIGRTQSRGYALADLTFTDSGKIPAYAAYYIRTMAAQGVISGYSDGSFKPNSNITRGQMAKILYNLM